ncbi:tyrosine-type recombinase/integrase [Bradyrhizobium sp. TZ2]
MSRVSSNNWPVGRVVQLGGLEPPTSCSTVSEAAKTPPTIHNHLHEIPRETCTDLLIMETFDNTGDHHRASHLLPREKFMDLSSQVAVNRIEIPTGRSEVIVFDEKLPGFGVRVRTGGRRTWIVQYRIGNKQRRVTLGRVGTLSAEKARREARTALGKVHLGRDPQDEKFMERTRAGVTLGAIVETYLTYARRNLKPKSLSEVERCLTKQWAPLAGAPAHLIERGAIAKQLNAISTGSGLVSANRARSYLSAMFNWAIREGLIDDNPAVKTNRATEEKSRDRVLDNDEFRLVMTCVGDDQYGAIVRLLAITGQRRQEVGAIRWSEIGGSLWSIPADRTKNGLPHDVPLSKQAIAVLDHCPRKAERDLVFGVRGGPFSGWSKAKAQLDERIAREQRKTNPKARSIPAWRLHDIRRTVATRMGDLGVQPHVIEAALNHISGHKAGVAGVYNRSSYAEEKRAALELWGKHLDALCGGTLAHTGNVTSIRK